MLVLGEKQGVRKRADAGAHVAEDATRRLPAGHPEIDRGRFSSARDHHVGEPELAVEFERAGLNGNRP